MKFRILFTFLLALTSPLITAGCIQKSSYPAAEIKESLLEICRKEYGIEDLSVKIAGDTLGVYLPLKKLFAADFKEAAVTGKVRNLETLFEPSPEALEKVEDVLFSISRVILSTDKPFKFYVLQATDIEKTGMQLVLSGYVDDIKRVRVSDISRTEYRKRVIHELRLNRAVLWHRPVHEFFKELEQLTADQIQEKYFKDALPTATLQNLFLNRLRLSQETGSPWYRWEILESRSTPIQKSEALVYAHVRAGSPGDQSGRNLADPLELKYLFLLSTMEEEARIVRIIPFQYLDQEGGIQNIPFPAELQIERSLDQWEEEFPLEELHVGPFLAQQLTRRLQGLGSTDERVQNTFREIKISFEYHEEKEGSYFSLNLEAALRDFNHYTRHSLIFHEDMLYLLNLASREFVDVLRSYKFGDYQYLRLNVAQDPNDWVLGRDDLELFRRKKIDLQGLLSLPRI